MRTTKKCRWKFINVDTHVKKDPKSTIYLKKLQAQDQPEPKTEKKKKTIGANK